MTADDQAAPMTYPFGEFLQDELDARGVPRRMLRRPLGLTAEQVDALFTGDLRLTDDIARQLGQFLGTSGQLWMNLDRLHRETS